MSDEEILAELRTIRTLLAIDKKEELEELTTDLSELQEHLLNRLEHTEWHSLPTSEIAEEFETTTRTVQKHRSDLENKNLVEKDGDGRGATYRKTGLLHSAEQIGATNES
jgi:DNA-binding MarR family transcriptional regulator